MHGLLHSKAQQAAPPYNNSSTQNSGQALQPLADKFPNPKLQTIPKSQTSPAPKLAIPSTQLVLKTLDFSSLHGLLHSMAQQAVPPYNTSSTQNNGQALQPLVPTFPNQKLQTIPKSQTSSAPKLAIPSAQLVLKTLDFSSLHGLLHSKAQQAAPPYNNSSTQNSGQALQPLAHKFPNPKLQTIPKSQTSPAPKLAIPSTQLVLKTLDFSSLHGLLHSMAQQAVPPYNNSITQNNGQALQPLVPTFPNQKLQTIPKSQLHQHQNLQSQVLSLY